MNADDEYGAGVARMEEDGGPELLVGPLELIVRRR